MELVLTFQQMTFGETIVRKPTLMQRFLILVLQVINPPMPKVFTEDINRARNITMRFVFMKVSKVLLLLQFSQLQEEWQMNRSYCFLKAPCLPAFWHKLCSGNGMGTVLPVLLTIEVSNKMFITLWASRSSKGSFGHSLETAPIDLIQIETKSAKYQLLIV